MILQRRLQSPVQFYFKNQKTRVLTVISEVLVPLRSLLQWDRFVGKAGEERWADVWAKKLGENFSLYSEAGGSKPKKIHIIRKLILLFLNLLNMSLISFSRAMK